MLKRISSFWLICIGLISCHSDLGSEGDATFEFIATYTATVTVGGVVGVAERTFEIGEVYSGSRSGESRTLLRIAEHTKQNEDCPNPWCYQEFLEVPNNYLRILN